jgi:hypothetical protein
MTTQNEWWQNYVHTCYPAVQAYDKNKLRESKFWLLEFNGLKYIML